MSQKKKIKKRDSDGDVDLLDKQEAKLPPARYKEVYHNDDFTPMNYVTDSLIHVFHLSAVEAYNITMQVHEKGKGIAKSGLSKEIAETKSETVVQFFRSLGYPLLSTFEKE